MEVLKLKEGTCTMCIHTGLVTISNSFLEGAAKELAPKLTGRLEVINIFLADDVLFCAVVKNYQAPGYYLMSGLVPTREHVSLLYFFTEKIRENMVDSDITYYLK